MLPNIKTQINRSLDLILFGLFTVTLLAAVLWANRLEVRSASPNDSTLPVDAADLNALGDNITTIVGRKVRIWFNIRNTGTTTWTPNDGYGWRGTGAWNGQSKLLSRNVVPGELIPISEEVTVPQIPGEYVYGVVLQRNGNAFSNQFSIKVTVRALITLDVHTVPDPSGGLPPLTTLPWSDDCTRAYPSACIPIKITFGDKIPQSWKEEILLAARIWNEANTKFRFVAGNVSNDERVIIPKFDNLILQNLRLAPGEIRVVMESEAFVLSADKLGLAVPYATAQDKKHLITALIVLKDKPTGLYWRTDGATFKSGSLDVRSVVAHEMGHALGIQGHQPTTCFCLMRPYPVEVKLTGYIQRSLANTDRNLLTDLYGKTTSQSIPDRVQLVSPSPLVPIREQQLVGYSQTGRYVNSLSFHWRLTSNVTDYLFQISDSSTFENLLYQTSVNGDSLQLPLMNAKQTAEKFELLPNQAYFWRVKSSNGDLSGDWSFPWKVRTETQGCSSNIDANCDGQVSLADYETWRQEYTGEASTAVADFSGNGTTDLLDYAIWQQAYFDPTNISFYPEPESVTQPVNVSFERSAMAVSNNEDIKVNIFFETDPDATVSMGSIAVKYPSQFLNFVRVDACAASQATIAGENMETEEVQSAVQLLDGETINIIHTPNKVNSRYPSGRFCFGALVFSQKTEFGVSNITELTLDNTFTRWEAVGPQVNFYTRFDGEKNMLRLFKGAGAVPDQPTLSSPAIGERFVEGTVVTLGWAQATNASQYAGEYGNTNLSDSNYSGKQASQTWTIGTLPVGEYWWQVEAYNDIGWWSGWSNRSTFTVTPLAPTNVHTTSVDCQKVTLAWENHSATVSSYQIARIGENQVQNYTVQGANSLQYVDLAVKEGQEYSYIVQAESNGIGSDASNMVVVSVPFCTQATKSVFLPVVQR